MKSGETAHSNQLFKGTFPSLILPSLLKTISFPSGFWQLQNGLGSFLCCQRMLLPVGGRKSRRIYNRAEIMGSTHPLLLQTTGIDTRNQAADTSLALWNQYWPRFPLAVCWMVFPSFCCMDMDTNYFK